MTATAHTAKATPTRIAPLTEGHAEEALAFLGERPLHTVIMAGLLRQHGTVVSSPAGSFYACRDLSGQPPRRSQQPRVTVARTDELNAERHAGTALQ